MDTKRVSEIVSMIQVELPDLEFGMIIFKGEEMPKIMFKSKQGPLWVSEKLRELAAEMEAQYFKKSN